MPTKTKSKLTFFYIFNFIKNMQHANKKLYKPNFIVNNQALKTQKNIQYKHY